MNHSILLSTLLISFFVCISYAVQAPQPGKLYEVVCKDTGKDNARCLKVLEADPKITSANNYLQLCTQILQMAIQKATNGQNAFNEAMKKTPSQAIKQCATSCYSEIVGSFKSSLSELVKSPKTANYDAKVAGDGAVNCQNALTQGKIVNPSLSNINNDMSLLSSIAFFATNHLP